MRLIYADVAKEMIVNHANEFSDVLSRREKALLIGGGTSCIDKCPTVDAVEVVHGRWEHDSIGFTDFWTCSACRKDFFFDDDPTVIHARVNYCPNCGAKLDGI